MYLPSCLPSTTTTSSSPAATSGGASNSTHTTTPKSSNTGIIAGAIVGGVVFVCVVAAAVFFLLRRRRRQTQAGTREIDLDEPMTESREGFLADPYQYTAPSMPEWSVQSLHFLSRACSLTAFPLGRRVEDMALLRYSQPPRKHGLVLSH